MNTVSADNRKIALVMPSFPFNSPFLMYKFTRLIEGKWQVEMVCTEGDRRDGERLVTLDEAAKARRRVHIAWPTRSRLLAALLLPAAVARCIVRNPGGTWRYLRGGYRRFGAGVLPRLYLDAELICLRPGLIHFEFGPLAVGRMHLRDLLGCAVIVSFRGYDLNYVALEDANYYAEVWQGADALHLLGEDLWRRAQHRRCPANKPHTLISPAIDTAFFDPGDRQHTEITGTMERPLRILSVGRLVWKKGYEFALQAVRALRDRGIYCEYRIVGSGDYLEALAFTRHQLELEDCVHLLGSRPPQEVKERMLEADVFLHSAVSEGFCNSVVEAQAMRLPVITSDADGLGENVADGETGFVVSRRDTAALAEKMAALASDPVLRDRMGVAGRQRAVERFQLKDQIAAFERLYNSVLKGIPVQERPLAAEAGENARAG